jgi:hypothetical protein
MSTAASSDSSVVVGVSGSNFASSSTIKRTFRGGDLQLGCQIGSLSEPPVRWPSLLFADLTKPSSFIRHPPIRQHCQHLLLTWRLTQWLCSQTFPTIRLSHWRPSPSSNKMRDTTLAPPSPSPTTFVFGVPSLFRRAFLALATAAT